MDTKGTSDTADDSSLTTDDGWSATAFEYSGTTVGVRQGGFGDFKISSKIVGFMGWEFVWFNGSMKQVLKYIFILLIFSMHLL